MIAPTNYDRIRECFLGACELSPADRTRYLDQSDLTDEEHDAVVKLLAADAELEMGTREFLGAPALDGETPIPELDALPQRIGPYILGESVGEGGMGIVFRAEQSTPVRRTVALKILRRGFEVGSILTRFEAERQTLAHLNHPGITQILDAGVSESGEHYFVMEFVDGVQITEYCRKKELSTVAQIELFLRVCDAVQHAHTKGIIHRDLKPSNILVSERDGEAVAKVIDFGIAKAADRTPGEELTLEGMLIGTPAYMSPEQACGSADLDTRTDVYSLGVVLYELLVGALPFDQERFREVGFAEIEQIITEEPPPRPSVRTESIPPTENAIARRRALRGDLDWILLCALEKEPTRRYESPAHFADDLLRHLRDEPIVAGPPSARVLFAKFIRRHRGGTILALAAFVAVITGLATGGGGPLVAAGTVLALTLTLLVATSALLRRARYAREAEARHRQVAEAQRATAEENRRLAAHHLDEVLRLSDLQRLSELEARADALWPALPSFVDEFDVWLQAAEELTSRLPEHRAFLDELREQSIGPSPADGKEWSFPTAELRWWHDRVAELVDGLERFSDPDLHCGLRASVEARRARASTIEARSITSEEARLAWSAAIEEIAALPIYQGIVVEPQIGFLPIGQNPQSGLWEFWALETGTRPRRDSHGRWHFDEESGLVFALIPGGSARVGAQSESPQQPHYDPTAESKESPVLEITLAPFLLSVTTVTQGQWRAWTGGNPSVYHEDRSYGDKQHDSRHPVEHVDWDECDCWLSRFDLEIPTEAQWEFAARAGTATPWWTGERAESLVGAANLADRFAKEYGAPQHWEFEEWLDDGYTVHSPVAMYHPNPFGLYDLHGNIWEWCRDSFGLYNTAARDPKTGELLVEPNERRLYRGGSCMHTALHARISNRILSYRTYRGSCLGVRPSRAVSLRRPAVSSSSESSQSTE